MIEKAFKRIVNTAFDISLLPFLALLLFTFIDVIARYIFNTSFFDAITLSVMANCMVIWLALPYVTLTGGHVNVSILTSKISVRANSLIDVFSSIIASLLFIVISWQGVIRAINSYKTKEFEGSMELPLYPVKFVFALGAILTTVAFLALLIKDVRNIKKGPSGSRPSTDSSV